MVGVDGVPADGAVEEGDDVHHRAAHTHMRHVQELAIRRSIIFISKNRVEYFALKNITYLNIIVEKFRFP